ncbi:MAG: aldose 1-epimerase [Acidimicrobiaceae bacterium]|jgi:galactose mutarotase-like enzyme
MLELHQGDVRLVLDPVNGGRVVSLTVGDLRLLRTPDDDPGGTHWGSFVMAPWAGRTRRGRFAFDGVEHQLEINSGEHSIHGTVRPRPWTVEEADPRRVRISCDFGPAWPFAGWAEQIIVVHDDRVELELWMHAADGPMPAVGGWHPWWQRRLERGAPAELELPAAAMYVRDAEGIAMPETISPPPPGPWDDCFTDLAGPCVLRWDGAFALAIESDCACVVVYDEPVDAICVEPQSGPPDALNHEPAVAEPGHPVVIHSTWRFPT